MQRRIFGIETEYGVTCTYEGQRRLTPEQLEVAVLDRHRPRRTFRRIVGHLLADLLNADSPTAHAPEADDGIPGHPDILSGVTSEAVVEADPQVPPPSDKKV